MATIDGKSDDAHNNGCEAVRIRQGDRVNTPLGTGTVQGFEFPAGNRLRRAIVRLDDPTRWAITGSNDPAFFLKELRRWTA